MAILTWRLFRSLCADLATGCTPRRVGAPHTSHLDRCGVLEALRVRGLRSPHRARPPSGAILSIHESIHDTSILRTAPQGSPKSASSPPKPCQNRARRASVSPAGSGRSTAERGRRPFLLVLRLRLRSRIGFRITMHVTRFRLQNRALSASCSPRVTACDTQEGRTLARHAKRVRRRSAARALRPRAARSTAPATAATRAAAAPAPASAGRLRRLSRLAAAPIAAEAPRSVAPEAAAAVAAAGHAWDNAAARAAVA